MKNTFYFSHDYSTRADDKIKKLIRKHGYLGYGIFWAIVEDLYQNANALQTDYEGIAYDMRVDTNVVKSVINDFDLFILKDDFFSSNSVEDRFKKREEKSRKAKDSANKRWAKRKNDANALQTQSDSNAIKERKGKDIKVKEIKINNNNFKKDCINDLQFMEVTAMQTKSNIQKVILRLTDFENYLIQTSDQKITLSDFKKHFTNWSSKNVKIIKKSNSGRIPL